VFIERSGFTGKSFLRLALDCLSCINNHKSRARAGDLAEKPVFERKAYAEVHVCTREGHYLPRSRLKRVRVLPRNHERAGRHALAAYPLY
jgi:hypothetical protein